MKMKMSEYEDPEKQLIKYRLEMTDEEAKRVVLVPQIRNGKEVMCRYTAGTFFRRPKTQEERKKLNERLRKPPTTSELRLALFLQKVELK